MTEDQMYEVFAAIETAGVTPWQKKLAISRLLEKGIIAQPEPKRAVVTQPALDALGKMKVQW